MAHPVSLVGAGSAGVGSTVGNTSDNTGSKSGSVGAAGASANDVTAADDADLSPAAKARLQLNASIMQASLTVSISAQDAPLALVYKSALTGINEALKSDFGDDAVQNAASQDNTPEGTAGRIVSMSTGFYEAYKAQHPGQDDATSLQNFMSSIQSGVEKGFKEARQILQGLGVLSGDVASNIDKTYALVQKGFADFKAAHQAATPADASATADQAAVS